MKDTMVTFAKKEPLQVKQERMAHLKSRKRICIYLALFVIALLVVARVLPWPILVAAVLVVAAIVMPAILKRADYCLLMTFVGFFIFTGNVGRIPVLQQALAGLVGGREVWIGVLTSQCISNVPAALLLSGFTGQYADLLLGVNIGGLGTMIASMASLISYKLYANAYPDGKRRYFRYFTLMNVIFLVILLAAYAIVKSAGIYG